MGKTSDINMRDLSKKILKQIEKVEDGKLKVEELEELVDNANELYERLVILKYKAYEKYGEPDKVKEKEEVKESQKASEKVEKVETKEETPEVQGKAFDLTGESSEEIEQPAFDFSISEEAPASTEDKKEKETFPEDEDIKNVAPKEDDSAEDSDNAKTFPEDSKTKGEPDVFKDSHVEKHEPEDENSLNQKLKDEEDLTLRKKLQKTPISDLKSEISIAKKFEYITFMFDGKNEIYEEAIDTLNSCESGDEAREKLNEYSTKFDWDLENKSIIKFVELVERRYL